jgi:nucleotide-binding universal stress UspA family protein
VIRRALALARANAAELMVATVVDLDTGFESDHVPFMTPQQLRERTAQDVSHRLDLLLARIGAPGIEARVLTGRPNREVVALSEDWRPDLIVGAARETAAIQEASSLLPLATPQSLPCDVLTLHRAGSGTWGRRIRAWFPSLATAFD